MNQTEHMQRLQNMLRQVAPKATVESPSAELESFSLPGKVHEEATKGLESLARNESLNAEQMNTMEAIILPKFRPAINIINGTFSSPPSPWEHLGGADIKQRLEQAFRSIGRVEVPGHPTAPYAGTGFVVGPDLMMTNRHVAEIFAFGLGQQQLMFKPGRSAAIDFKREIIPSDPLLLSVARVVMIHPYWDMALLQVSGLGEQQPVLPLSVRHPEDLAEHEVALIGYPAQDWRNAVELQNRIFGGVFDVKRLQPGKLKIRRKIESFGHNVDTVTHDASTLGGNSGSAVIDLATGEVVALHFAGLYLDANFAVPTYELARDSRVVQAGVNFTDTVAPADDWAPIWRLADPGSSETSSSPAITPMPLTGSGTGNTADIGNTGNPGNTAIWTIPLQISVTLGDQRIDLQPVAPTPAPTTAVSTHPVTPAAVLDEGLFGSVDTEVISQSYGKFAAASFEAHDFRWEAALSAASCSHLVYDVADVIIRTTRGPWQLDSCEFLENDDTECFVAMSPSSVIVSFRGTATLGDWLTDLNAFSTRADYGTVHRGFYFAFQAVKASLEKILGSDALTRRVILTGHSLGGALATIAAAEWQNKYPIAAIYTFGQPAVGKTDFHAFISGHYKDNFHRFVNDDDIVPKVPPTYKHVGRLYHFGPGNELQTTLTEALLTSDAPQTMSEAEFAALQAALRSGVTPATTESIGQEGFFPSVSDHKMDRYLSKVLSQLS